MNNFFIYCLSFNFAFKDIRSFSVSYSLLLTCFLFFLLPFNALASFFELLLELDDLSIFQVYPISSGFFFTAFRQIDYFFFLKSNLGGRVYISELELIYCFFVLLLSKRFCLSSLTFEKVC